MRCSSGVIKPPAQSLSLRAIVTFDLRKLTTHSTSYIHLNSEKKSTKNLLESTLQESLLKRKQCFQICIFPFIRVEIQGAYGQQTFRGKEFCESPLELAKHLRHKFHKQSHRSRSAKLPKDAMAQNDNISTETTYFDSDDWTSRATQITQILPFTKILSTLFLNKFFKFF